MFPQQRRFHRVPRQGPGALGCLGRRTLSRIFWANGETQRSWSADYTAAHKFRDITLAQDVDHVLLPWRTL